MPVSCGTKPSLSSELLVVSSGKMVVSWGELPSLPTDLLVECSEDVNVLDPNQCINK